MQKPDLLNQPRTARIAAEDFSRSAGKDGYSITNEETGITLYHRPGTGDKGLMDWGCPEYGMGL